MNIKIIYTAHAPLNYLATETDGSAGYDLRACAVGGPEGLTEFGTDETWTLWPDQTKLFGTGIKLDIGYTGAVGIVVPRSGLGRMGLVLANGTGVIDSDYRGEVMVCLRNIGTEPVTIKGGTRVAQLLFMPVIHPIFETVDHFTSSTARGEGGFGSTGVA